MLTKQLQILQRQLNTFQEWVNRGDNMNKLKQWFSEEENRTISYTIISGITLLLSFFHLNLYFCIYVLLSFFFLYIYIFFYFFTNNKKENCNKFQIQFLFRKLEPQSLNSMRFYVFKNYKYDYTKYNEYHYYEVFLNI